MASDDHAKLNSMMSKMNMSPKDSNEYQNRQFVLDASAHSFKYENVAHKQQGQYSPKVFDFSDSAIEKSFKTKQRFVSDESFAYPHFSHANSFHGEMAEKSPMNDDNLIRSASRYATYEIEDTINKDVMNHQSLVYEVRFKHKKAEFMLAYDCPRDISIGDLVKVEADRGTDIGEVDAVLPILSPSGYGAGLSRLGIPMRKILGRVSNGEAIFILSKTRDEAGALQVCRDMVARRDMEIQVLDAEFQFDRKKLTFIFTSDKRTDFRELVRDLFGFFKTRIWMQKVSVAQAAALKLLPPFMPHSNRTIDVFAPSQSLDMYSDRDEVSSFDFNQSGESSRSRIFEKYSNDSSYNHYSIYPASAPPTPKYYSVEIPTSSDNNIYGGGADSDLDHSTNTHVMGHHTGRPPIYRDNENRQQQLRSPKLPFNLSVNRPEYSFERQVQVPVPVARSEFSPRQGQGLPVDSLMNSSPSNASMTSRTSSTTDRSHPPSDYTYTTTGPVNSDGSPSFVVHHVYYSVAPPPPPGATAEPSSNLPSVVAPANI